MRIYSEQFSLLLEAISDALDIPESYYEQAVERYKSIGDWLERDGSKVANYSPEIYPQGSFLLGTVTKPVSDAQEYDLDLVSELNLQKNWISQAYLKNLVGEEIKSYAYKHNMNSPAEEGRRCWTLHYADDVQFHMDILPAIPDSEQFKQLLESRGYSSLNWSNLAIAITDRTHPNYRQIHPDWPCSNPRGYAEWFRSRMQTQFDAIRKSLMERQVEEVPEYKVKTPLQRSVQILKRHRDIWFDKNQSAYDEKAKPISIIITTLAGHAYNNEVDLQQALLKIAAQMPRHIEYDHNGEAIISNPVNPLENFADKWQEYPIRKTCFMNWLKQAQFDLTQALELQDVQSVGDSLRYCLGDRIVNDGMRNFSEPRSRYAPTVAANSLRTASQFHVSHRQEPKWQVIPSGQVTVTCTASRKGFRTKQIKHDSVPVPKHWSLRFEAQTNVLIPYEVHWQVVNTGEEALKANGLRGGFYKGTAETDRHIRKEETLYSGRHWIECFIVKDGICWARSGEFVVNIE